MCSSLAQGKRYWTAGRQTSTFSIRTAVSLFVHVASTLWRGETATLHVTSRSSPACAWSRAVPASSRCPLWCRMDTWTFTVHGNLTLLWQGSIWLKYVADEVSPKFTHSYHSCSHGVLKWFSSKNLTKPWRWSRIYSQHGAFDSR